MVILQVEDVNARGQIQKRTCELVDEYFPYGYNQPGSVLRVEQFYFFSIGISRPQKSFNPPVEHAWIGIVGTW